MYIFGVRSMPGGSSEASAPSRSGPAPGEPLAAALAAGVSPSAGPDGLVGPAVPPVQAAAARRCHAGRKYSNMPSRPPSRPKPLSLYPPNPAAASNKLVELIHTTPACTLAATSRARLMFSVQMLAA